MKKKLILIFIMVAVLFSWSCNKENEELNQSGVITSSVLAEGEIDIGTIAGDYIYRTEAIGEQNLLLKYHIPTGTATTVCQDPFCDHGLDCPFYVIPQNMVSIGNVLYYIYKDDEQQYIRSYNGNDMKIEQVYTTNGVLSRLFSYNYYLYFTDIQPSDNSAYNATVYRLDTRNNDIVEIKKLSTSEKIYQIKDEKILWETLSDYYYTDLNGNFLKEADPTDQQWGNYTYRNESNIEGQFRWENYKMDLYRKNISTGEETLVASGIGPYFFYGDKIIYITSYGKKYLLETIDGRNHYNYFGGEVFVMNLDGSDNHLLCDAEDCYILGFSANRNNEFTCGDWIGIPAVNYYENSEDGRKYFTTTDMLLVNIVTGEYKYVAYNPFE